jgi:hypothetical protein
MSLGASQPDRLARGSIRGVNRSAAVAQYRNINELCDRVRISLSHI